LHIARVPGEEGVIVRCSGDLTLATCEALRRELNLLTSLRQSWLVLNVSGCRTIDADGLLLLLDTNQRLRAAARGFVVVAGTDTAGRTVRTLGSDQTLPVFPTEASAALALRGGGPPRG
jgi:anti-anti-sigma factor